MAASDPIGATALAGQLAAAVAGDEQAFVRLTSPHRPALHAHCYRLLGSLYDADDAVQETMLRAWRGLAGFEPRGSLVAWLYRIATNVCLRLLEQRGRRPPAAADAHLEPYPDQLLAELPSPDSGPEAVVEAREAIGLAFVAAVQLLPPKQRAVLVLRDVLGWTAEEAAGLLGDSTAAVNSALQRARARLAEERSAPTLARAHAPASSAAEAAAVGRFLRAWDDVDIRGLVAALAGDVLLTMPPEPGSFAGAAVVGEFFATHPMDGRLERISLVETRCNGQPALAAYADFGGGRRVPYGLMVLSVQGEEVAGIVGFVDRPDLFERCGLPASISID